MDALTLLAIFDSRWLGGLQCPLLFALVPVAVDLISVVGFAIS